MAEDIPPPSTALDLANAEPATPRLRPDRQGAFRLLFACLVVVGAGNTMLVAAVLPPLAREIGLPDWAAGAIFSASAMLWVITSPIWARQSDRRGRRPLITFGLMAYSLSMASFGIVAALALLGWIEQWWVAGLGLLLARAIFGVAGSATTPAAQAYVADRTSRAERTTEIASLNSAFGFGQAGGPVIAGVLVVSLGLLAPLFVSAIVGLICAVMVARSLPEERAPESIAGPARTRWALVTDRRLSPYLIYGLGLSLVTGVLTQTFPFRTMDQLGVSGTEAATTVTTAITVGALSQLVVQLGVIPRLRWPPALLMSVGGLLVGLSCILIVFASDLASLSLAQMLSGVGFGLCRPGYAAGASLAVGPEDQGGVAGLVVAANGSGYVVSPLLGLWLYAAVDPTLPFWLMAALMIAMAIYAHYRAR